MSRAKTKLIPHYLQYAQPGFHLDRYLLHRLLLVMPPPWPGAPLTWRHARLRRIIKELAAFRPVNLAQAALARQIVQLRHMAADQVRRSLAHEVPERTARGLRRNATDMLRIAAQTERMLNRRPAWAVPPNDTPAAADVDLAELDAIWCGDRVTRPVADPAPDSRAPAPPGKLPAWATLPGWRC